MSEQHKGQKKKPQSSLEDLQRTRVAQQLRNLRNQVKKREIKKPKPYLNPYVAGVTVGIVLFLSFFLVGKGVGGSGAYTRLTAFTMEKVVPAHTENIRYFDRYLKATSHPLDTWLFYLFLGTLAGGFVSGLIGRRFRTEIYKGPNISNRKRLWLAFFGGILSAIGARLAGGCTSGLALTGGAMLGVGGWLFFISVFASGLVVAYFVRKQWL